jgi:hypothetical protein
LTTQIPINATVRTKSISVLRFDNSIAIPIIEQLLNII